MNYLKYNQEFDKLSGKEKFLLYKCQKSVEAFIKNSSNISNTNYATRGAHAKSYAVLQGKFQVLDNLPEYISNVFKEKQYEVLVRLSNANLVINRTGKDIPAYGFSLKIKDVDGKNANFPLVNFPLFPIKSVSKFLKFFTAVNTFLVTKADNFVVSAMDLPLVIKNAVGFVPHLFSLDFGKNVAKILKKVNDFILSFDFYSIGVYRLGDYMMKIKIVPKNIDRNYDNHSNQKIRTENYIKSNDADFDVLVQLCANIQKQPINDLTKEWKNAPYLNIGSITFFQNSLLDIDKSEVEKLSFNPFENSENLLPVGKIQQLRKSVYETSIKNRRS